MMEVLLALAGAVLGSLVTWLLGLGGSRRETKAHEDLAKAQQRLAEVEEERATWERRYRSLAAFAPAARLVGTSPDPQFIVIQASEPFEAVRLDYCIDTGATILSQTLSAASAKEIR